MTRSDYEERQEQKKDRLLERAARAEREGQAAHDAVDRVAQAIPFGQPILVGHHSEHRHRADLKRIDRGMRKSIEKSREATELRRRAEAVGTGGISSDDPQAVLKLREKLDALLKQQEHMKKVNAAWRSAGKPEPNKPEEWARVAETLQTTLQDLGQLRMEMASRWQFQPGAPFLCYSLSNLGAEIRRVRARIETLEKESSAVPAHEDLGICEVLEDPTDNRIRIVFPGKPEERVRALLKSWGFRWSPMASAWQRHLNDAGRIAARAVVDALRKEVSDGGS